MWGRALKITDPNGVITLSTYDNLGNPTRITDGKGSPTTYVYNTLNQISAITDSQGLTIQYKYDKEGKLTEETNRNGNKLNYTYNGDGNLTKKEIHGLVEYEEFLYYKDGNLLAAINNNSVETYNYTPGGLCKKQSKER